MPSHRRSSRATRRCSLQCLDLVTSMQSLVLDGSSDDENQPPRRSAKTTSKQQQQQQQPRRSKRIQEQNAKKNQQQLLSLPSSPVSTIDTPSSTITTTTSSNHDLLADLLPKVASQSVITPIKTTGKLPRGVHFGNNSVAKFSGCDPPMHMERLSPNASQQLFPREDGEDDDESSVDDETKQNCHILAQWDDSFDELDQIESDDDDDFVEVDNIGQEVELWRDATMIVEEEEDIVDDNTTLPCPYDLHRVSSRPTKRVDEYFCKGCGSGVRRTTRYVYEED